MTIKTQKVKASEVSHKPEQQNILRPQYTLSAGDYDIPLGKETKVMGIINATPDSFSDDGCYQSKKNSISFAKKIALKHIRGGADILDIGGESTRPGAKRISISDEIQRVIPVIKMLKKNFDIPISVDTYKPAVAKQALDAGATIINNIMGVKPDVKLLKMVRDYGAAIILMHIQGSPSTMQKNIHYVDLIPEIIFSLRNSIEFCLESGIHSDKIIVDPGIGFGKTVEHNLEIINHLHDFNILNQPLLIGTSRKSFIGNILDVQVEERMIGSITSASCSVLNGAHIVRAHDIKETKMAVSITDAIINAN